MPDMRWTISFGDSPDWPGVVAFLLVLTVTILAAYRYSHSRLRFFSLLALIAILALMFFSPSLNIERLEPPSITVIIDDSGSMDRPLDSPGTTPAVEASEYFAKILPGLERDYKIDIRIVSGFSGDDESDITGSPLGEVLLDVSKTTERALAVILLSDGIANGRTSLPDAASSIAAEANIPIFAVPFGSGIMPFDLKWNELNVPKHAFLGEKIRMELSPSAVSLDESIFVTVEFSEMQVGMNDEIIETKIFPARTEELSSQHSQINIFYETTPEKPGIYRYSARISGPEGLYEWNTGNNEIEFDVQVHEDRIRVLLVEHSPRFEYRFLREVLRREPTVDLRTLLLDADPKFVEQDPIAISHDNLLNPCEYQVIILGDVNPTQLGHAFLADTADAVRKGTSSILFIAGEHFMPDAYASTPLASLFPFGPAPENTRTKIIAPEGLKVEFRPESAAYLPGARLQNSFEVRWVRLGGELKLRTTVLATAGDLPLICARKEGNNLVFWHGTDETWLWMDDGFHREFWAQMIRFLAKGEGAVSVTKSENVAEDRNSINEQISNKKNANLGDPELERLIPDIETLRAAAEISGGIYVENRDEFDWPLHLPKSNPISIRVSSYPLPGRIPCFILLIIVASFIWIHGHRLQ